MHPILTPNSINLLTPIFLSPDESQEEAIYRSSIASISTIQGPPGTGKSQTIVDLLDELHHRYRRTLQI